MPTTTLTYEQAMQLAPEQEFFSGPPPEIGWWMVCIKNMQRYEMRWWSGEFYSVPVHQNEVSIADVYATMPSSFKLNSIQYCARFWEGK